MSLREYLGFLRRAWGLFRGARKTWRLPPRVDVLVVDRGNAEPVLHLLRDHTVHVADSRGESLCVPVMLLAGPRLLGGFHHYLRAYRRLTRARLVVSRTDNNLAIWRIKRRRNSNFMVLLIQNGWAWTSRGLPSRELLTWPKQLFVDRLALFGRHAEVMTVGHPSRGGIRSLVCWSLILNEFIREKPQATGCATVAILSTFRVKTVTLPDRSLIQTEQSSGAQEYERLESVLRRRGLSARVYCCGRAKALEAEKRFFQAHLRDPGLQFVERHRFDDSYRSLIKEQIVVSDVSTLGF